MKKISDLGAMIKSKHPKQYGHLADAQVGALVKEKYPADYNDYFDESTFEKVSQLMEYYRPNRGRLSSWWQRGKGEGRVALLKVINEEQRLVLEQGAMMAQAVMDGRRKMVDFEMFLAQHQYTLFQMKANAQLIEQALEKGYTLENYQKVKLAREENYLKKDDRTHQVKQMMKYENNQTRNQIYLDNNSVQNEAWLAKKLSKIKLRETKELESIRMNNEIAMMQEKVRLAIIAKSMAGFQKRLLVQELLDGIYTQIEDIKHNNKLLDSTKTRMVEDREQLIYIFKGKAAQFLLDE